MRHSSCSFCVPPWNLLRRPSLVSWSGRRGLIHLHVPPLGYAIKLAVGCPATSHVGQVEPGHSHVRV